MTSSNQIQKKCHVYFLVFRVILISLNLGDSEGTFLRVKRQEDKLNQTKKICGATGLRLNLDLKKLYGKWYPQVSFDMLHHLWPQKGNGSGLNDSSCLTLDLSEGDDVNQTMTFVLSQKNESAKFIGTRLGDASHPGMSKWAVTWPNKEDTLTSFVAAGTDWNTTNSYEWMWTVDCDINGLTTTGWTIFSRKNGISTDSIETILSIVEGIDGLNTSNTTRINPQECKE